MGGSISDGSFAWLTDQRLLDAVKRHLQTLPKELIVMIVGYFSYTPPTVACLPRRIRTRPPSKWGSAAAGGTDRLSTLIGSAVYLISRDSSDLSMSQSPLLVVWLKSVGMHTYLGLIFPKMEFNSGRMSLSFGAAYDVEKLGLPRADCSLVFYDLDVAQKPAVDVRYSICKINSLNLARHHNHYQQHHKRKLQSYPVMVAKLCTALSISAECWPPFHQQIHSVSMLALSPHHSWPWIEN